jgi:16S rRNA (adenine1518-N6/adenine1519-N6)-dimethyltransferase
MVSTRRSRELGQNFLVDRNILDVIARLSSVSSEDVVLEVGGGMGVLSALLAERAAHVHVVEIDERLADALRRAVAGFSNVSLVFADAVAMDLAALHPAPTKVVANLPYSVAATVILRTIEELPQVGRWVVMVQREVGERLAASPGTAAYGAPSVLAQLACSVRVLRPVSRNVFRPVPNVDSVLLGLDRVAVAPPASVRALVQAAFAHRRKTLAGSLALSSGAEVRSDVRERARAALVAIGHPADERAERLSPDEFVALAARVLS